MGEANAVDHPVHYGGADDPYEAIKVIEAWGLGFALGNAIKYISRAGKKGDRLEDLKKARWYLDREIQNEAAAKKEPLARATGSVLTRLSIRGEDEPHSLQGKTDLRRSRRLPKKSRPPGHEGDRADGERL